MESDHKLEPAKDTTNDNDEKLLANPELLILEGDITWRVEMPDTGENGNCFATGTFGRRSSIKKAS